MFKKLGLHLILYLLVSSLYYFSCEHIELKVLGFELPHLHLTYSESIQFTIFQIDTNREMTQLIEANTQRV